MKKGMAFVLSAPSGAGKSTLCRRLLEEFPEIQYSISCTTRQKRAGEAEGRDYFFISREEFDKRRVAGQFAEWAQVHGSYYGTPLGPVREKLDMGINILFDVDVQGAAQIKMTIPDSIFTFILPPSLAELEKRLRQRGLDDAAAIQRRMANARAEIREAMWYDNVVINERLEVAYNQLRAIYIAADLKPARNKNLLEKLIEE